MNVSVEFRGQDLCRGGLAGGAGGFGARLRGLGVRGLRAQLGVQLGVQ